MIALANIEASRNDLLKLNYHKYFKENGKAQQKRKKGRKQRILKIPDPLNVVLDLLFDLFWHALSHLVYSVFSSTYIFIEFQSLTHAGISNMGQSYQHPDYQDYHQYLVPQPVAQELLWQVGQWWRGLQGG